MMIKKNDIITLEITDISSDGNGVGKYENIAVFVPMTAVGDVCRVKILKVLSSYCFGKVEEIVTPSADRIATEDFAGAPDGKTWLSNLSIIEQALADQGTKFTEEEILSIYDELQNNLEISL